MGESSNNPRFQDLCGFNTFNAGQYNFGGERVTLSTFLEAPVEINNGEHNDIFSLESSKSSPSKH